MRRAFGIGSIVVVVGIGALIGFTAYQAGINEGIQRGADASQVVEVVRGPGAGLGFLALPLLLFAGLALVGGAKRRWARGYGRSRHGSGEASALAGRGVAKRRSPSGTATCTSRRWGGIRPSPRHRDAGGGAGFAPAPPWGHPAVRR